MNYLEKMTKSVEDGLMEQKIMDTTCNRRTDKGRWVHYYTKWYNIYFSPIKDEKLNIVELGISTGKSTRLWRDFFTNASIYGVDINKQCLKHDMFDITFLHGDLNDKSFLQKICSEVDGGMDIIIDDANHRSEQQINSFEYLFPKLNNGGIYIIEDLQTSYYDTWKKDQSMVDYLKNLVDDVNNKGKGPKKWNSKQNMELWDKEVLETLTYMELNIESIHFYQAICFIFKRNSNEF